MDGEQKRDRRPDFDFWWIVDAPTAFDEDRLIEISTDTDPGAMMQLVRLWDQNVGKKFRRNDVRRDHPADGTR